MTGTEAPKRKDVVPVLGGGGVHRLRASRLVESLQCDQDLIEGNLGC